MAGKIEIGSFKVEWGVKNSSAGDTYDLKGTSARENIFGNYDNFSGERVSEKRAHGLATVFSCLNVRARTMASLPRKVYRYENGQNIETNDHPAYELLNGQFNGHISSANGTLTSQLLADSWGNSVIGINRNLRSLRPESFSIIKPDEWNVVEVGGEAYYKINGEVYPSRDVLHYRWFSYDGLCGISPIRLNAITMGDAFKEARYASMSIGEQPPGFLHFEGNLNPAQQAQNQKSWETDRKNGRVPVLSGRWDYKSTLINPADAEYVMRKGLTDQDICGIFQMPPVFVQNYSRATWSNAEQADITYAKHTIVPICVVREHEENMKLFTEKEKKTMFTKHNLNGLLRGDIAARAAFYKSMRDIGGLNANEIRGYEDMNGYNGGEIYTVQSANIPVDQLRKFYEQKVAPTAGPPTQQPVKNGYDHAFN